jgi:hypothetical protein
MDVVAAGYAHRVVAGTAHMVRMRSASLVQQVATSDALVMPSTLFRKRLRPE